MPGFLTVIGLLVEGVKECVEQKTYVAGENGQHEGEVHVGALAIWKGPLDFPDYLRDPEKRDNENYERKRNSDVFKYSSLEIELFIADLAELYTKYWRNSNDYRKHNYIGGHDPLSSLLDQFCPVLHFKVVYLQNAARLQVLNRADPVVRPVERAHEPADPQESFLILHIL